MYSTQLHNNQLAFFDVLLTRTDDSTIQTQVYRKKTHTDQISNYNSNHPTQHKISCIKTLFRDLSEINRGGGWKHGEGHSFLRS